MNCTSLTENGGKFVMEHEALPRFAVDHLDLLLVVRRAERDGHEGLRFAAREHGRTVGAGKDAGLRW